MKTILAISLILSGCALSEVHKDQELIKKYPECYHQYRNVFDKCIELNEKGQNINALRVEELMKKGNLK